MRRVIQRQDDDCGIAALAMLLQIPYSRVRKAAIALGHTVSNGCTTDDFKRISASLGASLKVWHIGPKNYAQTVGRLENKPAILIVPAIGSPGDWHAVYWTGAVCLDPDPRRGYSLDGLDALVGFKTALVRSFNNPVLKLTL